MTTRKKAATPKTVLARFQKGFESVAAKVGTKPGSHVAAKYEALARKLTLPIVEGAISRCPEIAEANTKLLSDMGNGRHMPIYAAQKLVEDLIGLAQGNYEGVNKYSRVILEAAKDAEDGTVQNALVEATMVKALSKGPKTADTQRGSSMQVFRFWGFGEAPTRTSMKIDLNHPVAKAITSLQQ